MGKDLAKSRSDRDGRIGRKQQSQRGEEHNSESDLGLAHSHTVLRLKLARIVF